jgi:hypothetical protein
VAAPCRPHTVSLYKTVDDVKTIHRLNSSTQLSRIAIMQFNLFAFIAAAAAIGVLGAPATTTVSTGTVTSRVPTGTPITSRVVSTGTVTSRVSTIGSSPSSAFPPAPTPWIIVYPYCEALRVQCKKNEGTYFNKLNCVMMIACTHPFLSVQYAIDHVLWTGEGPAPKGYDLPRLSVNVSIWFSSNRNYAGLTSWVDLQPALLGREGLDSAKLHRHVLRRPQRGRWSIP